MSILKKNTLYLMILVIFTACGQVARSTDQVSDVGREGDTTQIPTPSSSSEPSPQTAPTPTPTSKVPPVIYEIIDSLEAKSKGKEDPLSKAADEIATVWEQDLSKNPTNLALRLSLAGLYQKSFQHRKALEYYLEAAEQVPEAADPLIGLGRLYYDLAIADMLDRGLTPTFSDGQVNFQLDDRARSIFRLAQENLRASKKLTRLVLVDANGQEVYIMSPGIEDELLAAIEVHLNKD